MGIERLILMLEALNVIPEAVHNYLDVYLVAVGNVTPAAMQVSANLREQVPGIRLQMHMGGGNFKKQMKKANESGAQFALILGEDEVANGQASIKPLRDQTEQVSIAQSELANWFNQAL